MLNEYQYVVNNLEPIDEKRIKIRRGAKVVLAKEPNTDKYIPTKYIFNSDYFTEESAEETLKTLGVEASKPGIGGRIWSPGIHHVFVDGEPARVYAPKESIRETYDTIKNYIKQHGSLKIGVDHLQDDFLKDNQILAKMNLLDVGDVTDITMDDNGIYIKDGKLTNEQIKALNDAGELPMYSIVGAMQTRECPSGKADYVIESLDINRVDIVEEGGCAACSINATPDEGTIITAKLSKVEAKNMAEETKEVNPNDAIEALQKQIEDLKDSLKVKEEGVVEPDVKEEEEDEVKPDVKEEEPVAEKPEQKEEQVVPVPEVPEEPEVTVDEKDVKIAELEQKLEELEGKKATFDVDKAVNDLVDEGRASPKMRDALLEIGAKLSSDDFKTISAALPNVMPDMEVKAKFAKQNEISAEDKAKAEAEEERKRILSAMGL